MAEFEQPQTVASKSQAVCVHVAARPSDIDACLGPLAAGEIDTFLCFDDKAQMPDLLVACGKFPSKGQARKNGWDRPVPLGYSHLTIGKGANRFDLWLLNRHPDDVAVEGENGKVHDGGEGRDTGGAPHPAVRD